jgi:gamma-glutamylcyclotransferase (GGCT)/AIG2-like uncharacterized protein YtfP
MQGDFLFVYGTLRSDVGHPMAEFLARRARFVGPAKMPGRLYDLGPYPGMREPESPEDCVHGELYELLESTATLAALDRYESLGVEPPPFVRQRGRATLDSGEAVQTWVYMYKGLMEAARHIVSGHYRAARSTARG